MRLRSHEVFGWLSMLMIHVSEHEFACHCCYYGLYKTSLESDRLAQDRGLEPPVIVIEN